MAFKYSELTRIKGNIQNEKDQLITLLNRFSDTVDENVNNEAVWYGTSSDGFKRDYDRFEADELKTAKTGFQAQINIVHDAIEYWGQSEQ